jgi:hypothetical protein
MALRPINFFTGKLRAAITSDATTGIVVWPRVAAIISAALPNADDYAYLTLWLGPTREVVRYHGDGTIDRGIEGTQSAWPEGTRIDSRWTQAARDDSGADAAGIPGSAAAWIRLVDQTQSNVQVAETPQHKIALTALGSGGAVTLDYDHLLNRPQINGVVLTGNRALPESPITNEEIDALF